MTSQQPLVSIGIPAYARPRELHRAIVSVLDQDVRDVEVVVGDDSGDLEAVVREIADERVVYVRNSPRLGMARNWNAVLDRARGRYLGLLMDDDRLLPGFLSAVLDGFEHAGDVGLVCTNHLFSDGTRTWTRECRLPEGRHDASVFTMLHYRAAAVSATVIRRDVWEAVRPLPDLLTADMVMHVRIALAGYPFVYIDRPLMVYAVHPGQQSAAAPEFRQDQVKAWEMFTFADPRAERLRRHRLARARLSVAAAHLRSGDIEQARGTARAAREFGIAPLGARGMAINLLVQQPTLARRLLALRRRLAGDRR